MLLPDQVFPPDYHDLLQLRLDTLTKIRGSLQSMQACLAFYKNNPVDFISDWVSTVDPRNAGVPGMTVTMPFYLFERQREMILFLKACLDGEANGLVEKSRDIGATWACCAFAVWLWRFWEGSSIGFGSRKQDLVDRIGDMDSIFEKIRSIIRALPPEFKPVGFNDHDHMHFMRIINPENGSTITGESGDDIGRGGRKRIVVPPLRSSAAICIRH